MFEPQTRADFTVFQTPTQTQSIEATQTNWGPGTVNQATNTLINDPFQIQQFNAAQYSTPGKTAVFYQVLVSLKYEFTNRIQMSFITPSTSTVTAQGVMHLNVNNLTGGGVAVTDIVTSPGFWTQKSLTYGTDIFTPNYIEPTPKVIASTSAVTYSDTSMLKLFSGTGNLSMPVYATAVSNFSNNKGNGAGGSTTTAAAALSVTYYYTFVPEPSSMALTGLGAVGLCVASRRRLRKGRAAV